MKSVRVTGMMMVVLSWVVLMLAGTFSPKFVQAEPKSEHEAEVQSVVSRVEGLTRANRKEREKAANAIRAAYDELIERLVELTRRSDQAASDHPWHETKHLSIVLLGDLRASRAIPVLLENLSYKNPRQLVGSLMDEGGWYPAAEALSKIGMPAVDPTIEKLSTLVPTSTNGELCCWVLKEILGAQLARARLQIAIDETRDNLARENLRAALPYFRTPQEKATEERAKEGKRTQG